MSDHKDQENRNNYSVDDILAEYGTSHQEKKVVEFPAPDQPVRQDVPAPTAQAESDLVDEIVPENFRRRIAARLSTLRRKADHYADHMYDQAEPDEKTLLAEKYIPGVDQEELPEEDTVKPRRVRRRPVEIPPDTAAADLARQYGKGLKWRGRRLTLAFLLSLAAVILSLDWPAPLSAISDIWADRFQLQCWVLAGVLFLVGALCWDILYLGVKALVSLRLGPETLVTFAWLFTLLDTLLSSQPELRHSTLPCAAVTAFGLTFHLWGYHARRRGDRLNAKTAAQARTPYVVTLDENKWSGKPAYMKWSGSTAGFGSQLQMADGATNAYRIITPLLLLGAFLCSLMASVGQGAPDRFLWAASCIFTAVSCWSGLLSYGVPYRKLTARLSKVGAAIAGWPGIVRCRQGGIIMTDLDLFPPGAVKVAQVKVFGDVSTEKVIGYTATLLRVLDCGLTRPFHDLLRAQGAFYREASGVRTHEGGITGIIRNQEVIVGTASFMHLMEIPMPQGINVKNAVFCALNGELSGMFLLNYAMSSEVNPSLSALMRANVNPILATRDFNLIPALLEKKFKLPVDRMEFPPVERRMELSNTEQEHDEIPIALLCREGLSVYSDAVVGIRRLRSAARLSLIFSVIGAVVGLCLTFYLTSVGAYTSLSTAVFLIFMALWLVPEFLIANWVNQY